MLAQWTLGILGCGLLQAQTSTPLPEFEAASIKPGTYEPDGTLRLGCNGGPGTADPGLYRCTNINLANLVTMAFRIGPDRLENANLGDFAMYNITAKVPPDTTSDQFREMLQNLLIQRFKLTYHYEKKEVVTYNLVVAKGGLKMKESSPGATLGGGSHMGPEGAKWTANKIAMPQLVARLSGFLGRSQVTDSTGLTGTYDFVLTWRGTNRNRADNDPMPTLEQAIEEQLGLKLQPKKGQAEMLVVDHAEKHPIEN